MFSGSVNTNTFRRILIYRLGSLSDTVVALPALHLITRTFPNAERCLLTNNVVSKKACLPNLILDGINLIHNYIYYTTGIRSPIALLKLRNQISHWRPDLLIYLAEPRGIISIWRDYLFFKVYGIKRIVGLPFTKDLRKERWLTEKKGWEHKAERLARCISILGDAAVENPMSWDLNFTH